MPESTNNDPLLPAVGTMLVVGGMIEAYEQSARKTQIAEHPVEGMVIHWSAQTDEGTITGTLWRSRDLAEHFLADVLADTFTELAGASQLNQRPRPDYSYEMMRLQRFTAGSDALTAAGRKVGEAGGAVLVRPAGETAALDLSDGSPDGLISHITVTDGNASSWLDVWRDREASGGRYGAGEVRTFPLHTLVVNPEELRLLPEYPPAE